MAGECGDCGLCCSLIGVEALAKPRGQWCRHFSRGAGCTVYENRPHDCRHFACAYITVDGLPEEWRPDRAGFLLWSDGPDRRLMVEVDPARPFSWKRDPYYGVIKGWSVRRPDNPALVTVRIGRDITVVLPEADIGLGPEQPRQIASGYREQDGAVRPFAEYL